KTRPTTASTTPPNRTHKLTGGPATTIVIKDTAPITTKTTEAARWVRSQDLSEVRVQGVRNPRNQLLRTLCIAAPITRNKSESPTVDAVPMSTSFPTADSTAATWSVAMRARAATPTAM